MKFHKFKYHFRHKREILTGLDEKFDSAAKEDFSCSVVHTAHIVNSETRQLSTSTTFLSAPESLNKNYQNTSLGI